MKIISTDELNKTALKLGKILGKDNGELLFVGCGEANKYLKQNKIKLKCYEVGRVTDNIDYLRTIILNIDTLEKDKSSDRHRKRPEKIIAQRFDYDCGWGMFCTVMLMINREDVLKTDVYSRLEVNPIEGTRSENIKKLLDEENIPYLEIWKADLTDVENVIKNNGIVMVSYQSEGTPAEIENLECGHYSIVFDIDEEFVWLIDPSSDEEYTPGLGKGVVKRMRDEFDKRWVDRGLKGEMYDHWMLAVRLPVPQ